MKIHCRSNTMSRSILHGAHNNTTHNAVWNKNTIYKQINTNKSMHSERGPVWQNPIQRIARTAHLSVLMTVHSFSTQNTSDNLHSELQTNIPAQMLSIGRESTSRVQNYAPGQIVENALMLKWLQFTYTSIFWDGQWHHQLFLFCIASDRCKQ